MSISLSLYIYTCIYVYVCIYIYIYIYIYETAPCCRRSPISRSGHRGKDTPSPAN